MPLPRPPTSPGLSRRRLTLSLLGTLLAACGGSESRDRAGASGTAPANLVPSERPNATGATASVRQAVAPANGGPRAHLEGVFGPVFAWPVMPIHMVLLPDRRVLAYGTDPSGRQGAGFHYALWDPAATTDDEAFLTLPNVTGTDIFCSAQSLLPNGQVVLMGGDENVGTPENFGNPDMNLFEPATNQLGPDQPMAYQRWYPTLVVTPAGERVVMGGRINIVRENGVVSERNLAITPEVFTPGVGWRSLTDATSDAAFGSVRENFYYPRAWLAPAGDVFILGHDGTSFSLDPLGTGTLRTLAARAPLSQESLPSLMYAPGRILSLRNNRRAVVVDINGSEPVVQPTSAVPTLRRWGNTTVLADGRVWLNGGSRTGNRLDGAHYVSEFWNPATGAWTRGASARQPRLYHSTSLLLADGSVLTGGGGAYGPVTLLDGEIYYPPYLFRRDGSGRFAHRPVITTAPTEASPGGTLQLTLGLNVTARRLTLVRSGSATHSFNHEQRFLELAFVQNGSELSATLPASPYVLPPGYYLAFVFNGAGVPSLGQVIRVTAAA